MHLLGFGVTALGLAGSAAAAPSRRIPAYIVNHSRAHAVKEAFQRGWDGYYKYAFPHDSLTPVSNGFADDRNGWGASAVDALSTAIVMGKSDVIKQIVDFIPTINFDVTKDDVSLFETTIRYLGGLLSGYDLISISRHNYANSTQLDAILAQAKHLADNLKAAFNTPSGVPDNDVLFNPPRAAGSTTNGIATIGTLILEWQRLSDITGDPEYGNLVQKAESYLLNPQPTNIGEPFPGLLGTDVNLSNGKFVDSNGGWVGGDDSFYEYLIKMYLYDPTRFQSYKDRWVVAAESSIKYLTSHPTTRPDLTFLAAWHNASSLNFVSQHLACFAGGNFVLGGLLLGEQRYVDYGLELTSACHETYTATTTGIGPETFRWQDNNTPLTAPNNYGPPTEQQAFYEKAGFWITTSDYILRPEVIESYYYAYRATGDPKYQEWAWDAFLNINKTCSVGSGFSGVTNVNAANGGSFDDFQETFWFAEVLKYSYLIHAEDDAWQLNGNNVGGSKFVFNTEAHPLRVVR